MSWLLFLDEPGIHQSSFPYGVLAGLAVQDTQVWPLVRKVLSAQEHYFGQQLLNPDGQFIEASALLGAEVFENASSASKIDPETDSGRDRAEDFSADTALSQAKIAYCEFVLALAKDYDSFAFAIPIAVDQIALQFQGQLRKDYAFLFERFFNFLKSNDSNGMGIIAIAERQSRATFVEWPEIVRYFMRTKNGRLRASRVLPAPVYTNGALNVLPHLAELISYAVSWAIRLQGMTKPGRPELGRICALCNKMRFSYRSDNGKKDWSFKYLPDLRPSTFPAVNFVQLSDQSLE